MNINFARYTLYCRHMDISFPKLCESYVHLSALSVDTKQTNSQLRTSEYTGQTTSSMQATHLTLREILRQDIEPTPYQRYPSFSFSFPPPETIRVLHPPFPLHQTPTSKPTPIPQSQNNDTYIRSSYHSHFPRPSIPQTPTLLAPVSRHHNHRHYICFQQAGLITAKATDGAMIRSALPISDGRHENRGDFGECVGCVRCEMMVARR